MATVAFEGFDIRSLAQTQALGLLSFTGWCSITGGGRTGNRLCFGDGFGGDNGYINCAFPSTPTVAYAGFALYSPITLNFSAYQDTTMLTSGTMSVGGSSTITVGASSAPGGIPYNTWTYCEIMVSCTTSGSVGSVVVRVNGIDALTYTGDVGSAGATITKFTIGGGSSSQMYLDDVYFVDNTGTSNNNFLGDTSIQVLHPTSDGFYEDMVGSDGSSTNQYTMLSTGSSPSTSTYVQGSSQGQSDTFKTSTAVSGALAGVMVSNYSAKSGTAARQIENLLRINNTDYTGTPTTLSSTPAWVTDVYALNPNTGAPWTSADIAALEFGVRVAT